MKLTIPISKISIIGDVVILQTAKAKDAASFADQMQDGRQYAAVLGEVTKRRSLDANAYAWALMNQLSEKVGRPSKDIYRDLVRDVPGSSEVVIVREDAAETFVFDWTGRGIGWQCEKIDNTFLPGYTALQVYRGSSEYDTKQMARLIELIVQECKQQDIPTMTPDEIAKLKGLVEDGKE